MPSVFQIVNWSENFENNRTREMRVMSWIPLPNKQDGDGYTELLDHPNGAAHYGVWVAILGVASKCEPRGTLLRDSRGGVRSPHDGASLSRMTRIPSKIINEALPRLVSIGWLEAIPFVISESQEGAEIPQAGADGVADAPQAPAEKCRPKEWNGIEEKEGKGTEEKEFAEFWSAYPKKVGKEDARKAWGQTRGKRPPTPQVIAKIQALRFSRPWMADDGKYIKHPAGWLRNGGWDDEVEAQATAKPGFFVNDDSQYAVTDEGIR